MKSTSSIVRMALLLALLSTSISVNGRFSTFYFANASQSSTIAVSPQQSLPVVGDNVTITLNVTNVVNLFAWQVVLKYNSTVLNLTEVWIPDDNVFANHTCTTPPPEFMKDDVDGLDFALCGSSLLGSDSVNASAGILFEANFTALSAGVTGLDLANESYPASYNHASYYSFLLDVNLQDIPFDQVNGDVFVGGGYFLTIDSTAGGTTDPSPDTYLFTPNSQVQVSALPEDGYDFLTWELDGVNVSSLSTFTVTMDTNHMVLAVFMPHVPVTWTVSNTGPADFRSIQDAIDSPLVKYGDIVFVKSGTYVENVDMSKKLTLLGEDQDTTIIDGNGTGVVVSVYGELSGFTIRNGEYGVQVKLVETTNNQSGPIPVSVFEDTAWIDGNRIVDNLVGGLTVGSDVPWVYLSHSTNSTISNNYIANNTVYGIRIWDAWNNILVNNTVENNEYGIDFYGGQGNNTLRNNTMVGNEYNFGVTLRGETINYMGDESIFSSNDVDSSNTVDGKPIYWWVNQHDAQVPSDAGYVLLIACTNISVENCDLSNNLQGILVLWSNGTMISNNRISTNAYGIYLAFYCSNNSILGNELYDNYYGVFLGTLTRYTTMRNNSISGGQFNFGLDPSFILWWNFPEMTNDFDKTDLANDIDSSNTVDGKPIVYWFSQSDRQVPSNAGFVMLVNCTDITVQGLNLTNNLENIVVFASNDTLIDNNYIANSVYAIRVSSFAHYINSSLLTMDVRRCFNLTVSDNVLVNNGVALLMLQSDNFTVSGNTFESNPLGIRLSDSNYGAISENKIDLCNESSIGLLRIDDLYVYYYPTYRADHFGWEWSTELNLLEVGGMFIAGSYNVISGNTVEDSVYGISLVDFVSGTFGGGNLIFHNNLINNHIQALEHSPSNQWDNGYPSGGNYWSDYAGVDFNKGPNQDEPGSDGIGDTAYVGRFFNPPWLFPVIDNYPLMQPWNGKIRSIYDVNGDGKVNMIDIGMVAKAFGTVPGDARWNPACDVDRDGKVDMRDIALVARNFGWTPPNT